MDKTVERSFRLIDTIVIVIIVYFLIKWTDSHYILPSWGALCESGIIGIISYKLLPYEKIGRIIQAIVSLFEAYFFATLFPFKSWLKKTPLATLNDYSLIAVITILLFLLIFELHDNGTSETIKNIIEIFHDKKISTTTSNSTASSTYRESNNTIYNNLLNALGYSDDFNEIPVSSLSLIQYIVSKDSYIYLEVVSMHNVVSQKYYTVRQTNYTIEVYNQHGTLLETVKTTVTVGNDEEFRKLFNLQERYHLYHCKRVYNELEARKQIAAWKNAAKNSSETYNHQSTSEAHTNQENSSQVSNDEALFNGCTDKESLTKRYHQLMKTFHPDNPNGDQEMSQRIQNAYETLCKKYN